MMRGITIATCSSASACAVSFVALFTNGKSHPATFNSNYRYKIALYFLLLCGIIYNGEIFKFDSGFFFMSSHLTIVTNPCAAFTIATTWICEIASCSKSDEWGTLVTPVSISSGVESRPTKIGHPTRAYYSNKFSAGCRLALHLGDKRPRHFQLMNTSSPVISLINHRWSSDNDVVHLFFTNVAECYPVLVLSVQMLPMLLTSAFLSGSLQVESARPTRVLNSMLGIADGRSDLS